VREPSEAEVLRAATKAGLATVFTSLPGKVVSYDPAAKTAVVEVAVHDGDPPPPLPDVPVKFPRGGGYRLVWPLEAGDEVTLIFYGLDPSRFRASGEVSAANIQRRHGLYPVALPGAESETLADYVPSTEGLHLGKDDGTVEIVVGEAQIKLGSPSAVSGVAKGDLNDANFTALLAWLTTHVHPTAVGPTSPSTTAPPVFATTQSLKVLTE
jgi:Phage protein Gp138 N-terminal domain